MRGRSFFAAPEGAAMAKAKMGIEVSDIAALTPRELIAIDYLPVPPVLADHVTTFYHFRCDEPVIRDFQPAAIGQLGLFLYGEGSIRFADGRVDPSHRDILLTHTSAAAAIEVDGPFHAIGAALSPLGFAALTGLDARENADRLLRASDHFGPEMERLAARACERYAQDGSTAGEIAGELARFIAANLSEIPAQHRALIGQVNSWLASSLTPEVDDLYREVAYSERQAQRLVECYFGMPPKQLARKYRALRAAMWLSLPVLNETAEAQLADAFSDQSHMIREIRHFVGRTPARLRDEQAPILNELIGKDNFREIGGASPTG